MPNNTSAPDLHVDINPGTLRAFPVVSNLTAVKSQNGLNQIRGIAGPKSTGAGVPRHVTNLSAVVKVASSGQTSTVSVCFHQDPTDSNFAGVNLFVKGYQGNQNPVQVVSSTSSPATFVVNNTGENVAVIAQAYGNSGSAPFAGAPTTSVNLGTSTTGGWGVNTNGGLTSQVEAAGQSVVTTPTTISNVVVQGSLLSLWAAENSILFPGVVEFDVFITPTAGSPLLNVAFVTGETSSAPNGYMFGFDGRAGQNAGCMQSLKAGNWQLIGSAQAATNASALTGWHNVKISSSVVNSTNSFSVYVDGVLQWSADSSLFTVQPNTPIYVAVQGQAMQIAPSGWTQKSTDNLPNGVTTFLQTPNSAFAMGSEIVGAATNAPLYNPPGSLGTAGNTAHVPPGCISFQAWVQGGRLGVMLDSTTSNKGYLFQVQGGSGDKLAVILRCDSLSGNTFTAIGTNLLSNNAANFTGWVDIHVFYSDSGILSMYLNGKLCAYAVDTTFGISGATRYWYVTSQSKIGAAPAVRQGSTFLNGQGSLSTGATNIFTYTSTTTSITWKWVSTFTLYGSDGSSITVAANSGGTTFSGLSSSTTYYFGMAVTVATGVCTVYKSDVSSGTAQFSAAFIQGTLNGDGNSSIAYNVTGATPSSGSGGGSGGGGGGGCFTGNTKLACGTPIADVQPGQLVLVEKADGTRVHRPVRELIIHDGYKSLMSYMGADEFVTPEHPIKDGSKWVDADVIFPMDGGTFVGALYDLEIDTADDDERNFVLANGHVVHNKIV